MTKIGYANHTVVSEQNIADVKAHMSVVDQREALEIGCLTWGILYGTGQSGQITVWPNGRAAICTGGDSEFGDWEPNNEGDGFILRSDNVDDDGYSVIYDEDGELLPNPNQR
jgi:hypothetical protein